MISGSSQVRREVTAELVAFMQKANEAGRDPLQAAEQTFPDVPLSVLAYAWAEFDDQETERWWETLERTIDGEVIRNALTKS